MWVTTSADRRARAGRIPGRPHPPGDQLPRGVLEFRIDPPPALADPADPALSRRRRPIVIYCRTGGGAALAAQTLQRLGFEDVCSIAGGIFAWAEAGLPVVVP